MAGGSDEQVERLSDQVAESLYRQLSLALQPQLLLLGLAEQRLPREGRSGLGFATGYLLGLCDAVLAHNEKTAQDRFMVLVAMVFRDVYGDDTGWDLALDSIDAFQAGEASVLAGANRAGLELDDVYRGQPFASPMGFYLYVSDSMET